MRCPRPREWACEERSPGCRTLSPALRLRVLAHPLSPPPPPTPTLCPMHPPASPLSTLRQANPLCSSITRVVGGGPLIVTYPTPRTTPNVSAQAQRCSARLPGSEPVASLSASPCSGTPLHPPSLPLLFAGKEGQCDDSQGQVPHPLWWLLQQLGCQPLSLLVPPGCSAAPPLYTVLPIKPCSLNFIPFFPLPSSTSQPHC